MESTGGVASWTSIIEVWKSWGFHALALILIPFRRGRWRVWAMRREIQEERPPFTFRASDLWPAQPFDGIVPEERRGILICPSLVLVARRVLVVIPRVPIAK